MKILLTLLLYTSKMLPCLEYCTCFLNIRYNKPRKGTDKDNEDDLQLVNDVTEEAKTELFI